MDSSNYTLPFKPSLLMKENGAIETCDIAESIAQNIMLLIITKKGENRYDDQYGNDVWNLEFDNGVSTAVWENVFIKSLKRQIADYEPRILSPEIKAHIIFVEHNYDTREFTEIKKKVKIAINAKLESTGEQYNFVTELFLSPMSID
ncbi:GPW/gp25 family protein [Chryseobacterium sp. SNU WT5]|uniref:GPW/gp25 family protein n=1 Tax=Chryseobacterium sp. SNU WT5 TaxID=2594269 RepID=UPI0011808105|nr:GPW/gp25 family protein [Chryseobacterium sp. SNU WT5]QDP84774.1 GPW/gp25 family protein [Chryseobacterium sp. SNU WT5]